MADKKIKDTVDSEILEEEAVTTQERLSEAKKANAKAAKTAKEAAKADAKATAAIAKDTAQKTKKVAQKGAEVTKETAKKAAKKTASATSAAAEKTKEAAQNARSYTRKPKRSVVVQCFGREIEEDELIERAIAQFASTEGGIPVKKISLYIKPEEMAAYYVINEQYTGRVDF